MASGTNPEFDALRALRPLLFRAVAVFLHDADSSVRDAALAAAVAFAEAPEVACRRPELVDCARRVLASSANRNYRYRAADCLATWGQDTEASSPST